MKKSVAVAGAVIAAAAFLGSNALFVVNEARQALVLQFGQPVRTARWWKR